MSTSPNKLSRFCQELKRRNVLRSLAIYAGTAFIILEASSIIFPLLEFARMEHQLGALAFGPGSVYQRYHRLDL